MSNSTRKQNLHISESFRKLQYCFFRSLHDLSVLSERHTFMMICQICRKNSGIGPTFLQSCSTCGDWQFAKT